MKTSSVNSLTIDVRLALRNIVRQRRRTILGLIAILFGVVAMMLSAGYIQWIYNANKGVAVQQLGHIQISRPGYHDAGLADPYRYLLPKDNFAEQVLNKISPSSVLSPRLSFNGLISHGDNTLTFIGEGVDPDKDPSIHNILVTQGQLLSNIDPKGFVLGTGLAANLGVKTGDDIVLLANTASGGINAVEGKVRGLVSTAMKVYDDNMLRVPIATARQLLRTDGAHIWVITLKHTADTEEVVKKLEADRLMKGYEIVPWITLADFYNKTVALFSRQMAVVKLIIAIIIVLSISNTMMMSVRERTVEIGTVMALGIPRRRILRLFLFEGSVLGVFGGMLGVTLGYVSAEIISAVGIPMPPAPGMSRGFIAGITLTPEIIFQAMVLALVTTLLASIYPAWRASQLDIVDALRHNR